MTRSERNMIMSALIVSVFAAIIVVGIIAWKRIKHKERYRLIANAKADYIFWNGKKEAEKAVSNVLVDYWKYAGINFDAESMQDPAVHSKYPWSSAYISSLVLRSGYENFKGRPTHASYVVDAKENRAKKMKNSFWAFSPSEKQKVEIGDIIVQNRSGSTQKLANITRTTPTHGDIVIDFGKKDGEKYAIAQGGNVGNSVKQTWVKLTSDGTLPENGKHFAHLKYIP